MTCDAVCKNRFKFEPIIDVEQNLFFGYEILSLLRPDSKITDTENYFSSAPTVDIWDILGNEISFLNRTHFNGKIFINIPCSILLNRLRVSHLARQLPENTIIELQDPVKMGLFSIRTLSLLRDNLQVLRHNGFQIWIDDVSTITSGLLSSISDLIDGIKIDKFQFWQCLEDNSLSSFLTELNSLSPRVLAEGVETDLHLQIIRLNGIQFGQGYKWPALYPWTDPTPVDDPAL